MPCSAEGQVHGMSEEVGGRFGRGAPPQVLRGNGRLGSQEVLSGFSWVLMSTHGFSWVLSGFSVGSRWVLRLCIFGFSGGSQAGTPPLRFGTVGVCRCELRDLKKAKGTKRKRLQVDFISGISESVAVDRIKENMTARQTSVEAKRKHFQAIAATIPTSKMVTALDWRQCQ